MFALRVSHPHIDVSVDRTGDRPRVRLRDVAGRSARVEATDGGEISVVGDGRDLWTALRPGYRRWRERGRPEQWDFGMTVTRQARTVWVGSEDDGPYTA